MFLKPSDAWRCDNYQYGLWTGGYGLTIVLYPIQWRRFMRVVQTLHDNKSFSSTTLWHCLKTESDNVRWKNCWKHRVWCCRDELKCDGTRAETIFRLSAKRTSPFKSAGTSVQSTTDSRGVHISGSNAGYTVFRGSVEGTGYQLHLPVFLSHPLPCVTVCHHVSTGVYTNHTSWKVRHLEVFQVLTRLSVTIK